RIWLRAQGLELGWRLALLAPAERLEDVSREHHAGSTAERIGPVRRGALEDQLDRVIVDPIDAIDYLVRSGTRRRRRRVGGVLPGEDDIGGGERAAVVPHDPALQSPYDPRTVARDPAVGHARPF